MNDKFERLKNMFLNNIKDTKEPIDDTLSDIIGYALLWKMLRAGSFALPLAAKLPLISLDETESKNTDEVDFDKIHYDMAWQKSTPKETNDSRIILTTRKGDQ